MNVIVKQIICKQKLDTSLNIHFIFSSAYLVLEKHIMRNRKKLKLYAAFAITNIYELPKIV